MNYILFVFLGLGLFGILTCSLKDSNIKSNENSVILQNKQSLEKVSNYNLTTSSEKIIDIQKKDLKHSLVWIGAITVEDLKKSKDNNSSWSNSEIDNMPNFKEGAVVEVDIMNCVGYLVSGKIKNNGYEWRLEIIPETSASDATEKIKQCDNNPDNENNFVSSNAFAIAPQHKSRQNIRISKINTKKLFASLTKDTQKWLKNKYASAIHKRGDLSLEEDNWTDIDGDGKIDLVFAFTNYDEEHSSGVIMLLVNGKWKDIGVVQD